jgi:hypothetical protein
MWFGFRFSVWERGVRLSVWILILDSRDSAAEGRKVMSLGCWQEGKGSEFLEVEG